MTNFEKYVEEMEQERMARKRAQLNAVLHARLKEGTRAQTILGLYEALGLLHKEAFRRKNKEKAEQNA